MANRYNLRSAEEIISGLFAEREEEPDDVPSDSEANSASQQSDVETDEGRDNSSILCLVAANYSDEGQESNYETKSQPEKKRRKSTTPRDSLRLAAQKSQITCNKNDHVTSEKHVSKKYSTPIIRAYSPGPVGAAREAFDPFQAWSLLFPDDLLDKIVLHTNEEIARSRESIETTTTHNSEVTRIELNAFLGLLYFAGMQKSNNTNIEELWSLQFGSTLYRATMACSRFKFLLSTLCFDEKLTRNERRKSDKFASIREIWQKFIGNCKKCYSPHEQCTVHEQLIGFRGSCPFKVWVSAKPERCGLNILMLNDRITFYMLDAKPYLGEICGDNSESSSSYDLRTITGSVHGTGRTITCNDRLASEKCIKTMKNDYGLTIIGEVRKNIDSFDQLCHEYSTARKTQRWPMRVFYGMLDQGGINAYILYSYNISNEKINRLSFLKSLIMSLLEPHLKMRMAQPQLRRNLRVSIQNILNIEFQPKETKPLQTKRCFECPREKDRKTRVCCSTCKRHVCDEHRVQLCLDCALQD